MNSPEFTAFAEVYTHPNGEEHRPLAGFVSYKSGLTPISIAFPTPINSDQIRQDLAWESYQITHFKGFATAELEILETLANTNDSTDDVILNNTPIHPAFAKSRWMLPLPKNFAEYSLGLGREGYWSVRIQLRRQRHKVMGI